MISSASSFPKVSINNTAPLTVEVETESLILRSIRKEFLENYIHLFQNAAARKFYATGPQAVPSRGNIERRVEKWVNRFERGNPFSAMAIFEKGSGAFVGHTILGGADDPDGEVDSRSISEFDILLDPSFWNQKKVQTHLQEGYGTQVTKAMMLHLAPALKGKDFWINGGPLKRIYSFCSPQNLAGKKILEEKIGMTLNRTLEANDCRLGVKKHLYHLDLD